MRVVVIYMAAFFRPLIWVLSFSTNCVLRLLRIDPKDTDEEVTEEEIMMMVESSEEDGNIEAVEKEMIENIFEFNNTTASDVMIHRTVMSAISIDETFDNIHKLIVDTGFSRFPVYKDEIDNIVGILSTRMFLINRCSEAPKALEEIIYDPKFVPESVRADVLFRDMQENKVPYGSCS